MTHLKLIIATTILLILNPSWTGPRWLLAEGDVETLLWFYGVRGPNGKRVLVCCLLPTSILDRPHPIGGFRSFCSPQQFTMAGQV